MTEKFVAACGVAFVALLYLAGYAYLDGYYEFFDIGVNELELSPQHIFAHSAPVYLGPLRELRGQILNEVAPTVTICILLVFISSILLVFISIIFYKYPNIALTLVTVFAIGGMVIVPYFYAHDLGKSRAEKELHTILPAVVLEKPGETYLSEFQSKFNEIGLLYFLTASTTKYFFVYRIGDKRWWVLRVPITAIAGLSVHQNGLKVPQDREQSRPQ
ncbi:hypothetical protein [Qingshengfaniella alkalisoli]|uniref:Uncharacterized protein n=1 Tax=Qingshengfaniella alkalisoli TaxID=2599296 RepID=A0A5B8J585_9RHOB|nr:hypothetical protein [Qingshengfaniella alkalisoli]QDY69707.1 hypothetical protein FPZ52_08785 [Qingshengfaniella alkalisoli]